MKSGVSIVKRIVSAVLTGILILSAVLCFSVVFKTVGSDKVPDLFGYRFFYIVTGSMEPNIHVGETIIVKKQNEYEEGDVIAYIAGASSALAGQTITHRVIRILTGDDGTVTGYLTQGDANSVPDTAVSPDRVYGKMVWQSGESLTVSRILSFFTDRNGFFLILIVPLALLSSAAMKEFRTAQKKYLEEKRRECGENAPTEPENPNEKNDKEERP